MNVVAAIVGTLLLIGGVLVAIFARQSAPVLRRLQTRVYGQRLGAKTNLQLTERYVRFIATVLAVCGGLFLVLATLGAFAPSAA